MRRELGGGLVAEAAVRPLVVVLLQPPSREPPRFRQVRKLFYVQ